MVVLIVIAAVIGLGIYMWTHSPAYAYRQQHIRIRSEMQHHPDRVWKKICEWAVGYVMDKSPWLEKDFKRTPYYEHAKIVDGPLAELYAKYYADMQERTRGFLAMRKVFNLAYGSMWRPWLNDHMLFSALQESCDNRYIVADALYNRSLREIFDRVEEQIKAEKKNGKGFEIYKRLDELGLEVKKTVSEHIELVQKKD